jgi:hypothetical protein
MEVINGSFSKLMTHETKALEIIIGSHTSKVVFNVISSLTKSIIVGLSCFILHNLRMDWDMKSFHLEIPKEKTSKCKAPLINLFSEN